MICWSHSATPGNQTS